MDYRNQFQTYLKVEEGKGARTVQAYLADVRRFKTWLDAEVQRPLAWEEVTTRHIRAYTTWLSTERRVTREDGVRLELPGVGPRYIGRVVSSLGAYFDYLTRVEKLLEVNPVAEVRRPKIPKRASEHLTVSELRRLINAAVEGSRLPERVRNWTLIAFLFNTGLRVSELCDMKVSDIRYRDGLPASLRVIGKGDKERRVALSPEAQRALQNWLKERAHVAANAPLEADLEHVWLTIIGRKAGKKLEPSGVRALLRRFGKLAGISKNVHPHLLRHSFATEAVRNGAKIHGLQRALGHASIATTGIYLHADEEELEQVASVIPSLLGKGRLEPGA